MAAMEPATRQERHARAKVMLDRLLRLGPTDQRVLDRRVLLDELEKGLARGNRKQHQEIAREWLQTQSYDEQWEYGVKTLQDFGIVRSDC